MSDNQTQQPREHNTARRFDAFLAVVIDSFTSLFNNLPAQAAASIAYYFLFSVFPLFVFMVIVLCYFLDLDYIQQELIRFVQGIIPGVEVLISENLQNLLDNRGSTSIMASVSLLWSGSGMINSIISNVQKAWPETRQRGYFINRALAILLIVLAILLIAGIMLFSLVFNLSDALTFFNIELSSTAQMSIKLVASFALPMAFLYLAGFALFYMIPTAKVDRSAARISALILAVLWPLFTRLFGSYVLSPMNRYDLVYGSVTVIVLLLLYIYFSAFIILYFAHLTAAITHYRQRRAGLFASAPINPQPVRRSREKSRNEKGRKQQNQGLKLGSSSRTLNDPIELKSYNDPVPKKQTLGTRVWNLVKDLFRWK